MEIEPRLQSLDNERLHLRGAVTSSEVRLDIKAGGFWSRGITAFFDVRVTHVNSKCYQNKTTSEVFKEQEGGEETQVPAAGTRCRDWFIHTFSVWNQWRNGK